MNQRINRLVVLKRISVKRIHRLFETDNQNSVIYWVRAALCGFLSLKSQG